MDIKLKNIKFSEHLSEETNAFTANLYVDGKLLGSVRNDGCGGNTNVGFNRLEDKQKFREVEEYCKTLPPQNHSFNNVDYTIDSNLEVVVDTLFEEWLKQKEVKKMERKMKTSLLWGIPNGSSFRQVNFKRPLNTFPHTLVQEQIDKWKEKFEDGEVYLNTNLDGFNL